MNITSKTALITGAAAGIGRATALALAATGARHITLCDLDKAGLTQTARLVESQGAATLIRCFDVTDHAALTRAIEETDDLQGLDILFNNAGIVAGLPDFPVSPAARMALVVAVNLTAVVVGTAVGAQRMRARGGGVIVNTASTGALRPGLSDAPYRASKAGVVMLSQCCKDLAAAGVRVNAIAPGVTETPILDKLGNGITRPEWLAPITAGIRLWQPSEIAARVIEIIRDDGLAGECIVLPNEPVA